MKKKPSEGYKQALKLLHSCCTPDGFLATITDSANYRRIWARDGVILSLAALAKRGKHEQAAKFLQGIHQANTSESDGEAWLFPEFIHGKKTHPLWHPASGLERRGGDHRRAHPARRTAIQDRRP